MDIFKQLQAYEGTKEYQESKGFYHDGKFWIYKDSIGFSTIGYGRLVQGKEEQYKNGITEEQADAMLREDIESARSDAEKLKLNLPKDSKWNDFIVLMIFQLGLTKTLRFKKFLAALKT